eukprot:TRINITY_DN15403_c0_g1_i1.p1 TRINITY_DN15403_c0_g1~~TRINITY_DN15403_c0_g1_i1.p1  ORF type:complete len:251 (+),score=55.38 TRINITY_DN15403_c0_g1_i1:115-867(+)
MIGRILRAPTRSHEVRGQREIAASGRRKGGIIEKPGATEAKFKDLFHKHRKSVAILDSEPFGIEGSSFIAPDAILTGKVAMKPKVSIWYGCTIKADNEKSVMIGYQTNIQDGSTVSVSYSDINDQHDGSVHIGSYTTIGHRATLTGCKVGRGCLVGMGSVLEEGSHMERASALGANSVLTSGSRVKEGELWTGIPAKFHRELTGEEILRIEKQTDNYIDIATQHATEFTVDATYREGEKANIPMGWKDML